MSYDRVKQPDHNLASEPKHEMILDVTESPETVEACWWILPIVMAFFIISSAAWT